MPHKDKDAARAWRRKWWAERADMREKQRVGALKRSRSLRQFLNEIKMARGCIDCGYNKHPAALDFDHVDGSKLRLVSFAKSQRQALEEIEKCEVRCSNCHRIKTWERRPNRQPCKPDIFAESYEMKLEAPAATSTIEELDAELHQIEAFLLLQRTRIAAAKLEVCGVKLGDVVRNEEITPRWSFGKVIEIDVAVFPRMKPFLKIYIQDRNGKFCRQSRRICNGHWSVVDPATAASLLLA